MSVHHRRRWHAVLSWWCRKHWSVFLRPGNLLAHHAAGPCVLGRGHRLDAEGAVALRELHILAQGRRLDADAAEALRELHRP